MEISFFPGEFMAHGLMLCLSYPTGNEKSQVQLIKKLEPLVVVHCVVEDMSGWEIPHLLGAVTDLCDAEPGAGVLQSVLSLELFTLLKFKAPKGRLSYGKASFSAE